MCEKVKLITRILLFQLQEVRHIFTKTELEAMAEWQIKNIISDINNNYKITKESAE